MFLNVIKSDYLDVKNTGAVYDENTQVGTRTCTIISFSKSLFSHYGCGSVLYHPLTVIEVTVWWTHMPLYWYHCHGSIVLAVFFTRCCFPPIEPVIALNLGWWAWCRLTSASIIYKALTFAIISVVQVYIKAVRRLPLFWCASCNPRSSCRLSYWCFQLVLLAVWQGSSVPCIYCLFFGVL